MLKTGSPPIAFFFNNNPNNAKKAAQKHTTNCQNAKKSEPQGSDTALVRISLN